jgi:phospholipid/cholesterol/gamma-HCH transport system substrate-binding protein
VSRSLTQIQAFLLGTTVLGGIGLGTVLMFLVGSRGWFGKDALDVRVAFREVRGVDVGTRVRIQGVDAGEVIAIVPPEAPDGPVLLRLRLKVALRHLVRSTSTVRIVSEGMLGAKVLEVQRGQVPAGAVDEPVADNALLLGEPALELGDVIGQVGDAIKGIQGGEGTLGKLAQDKQAYEALVALLAQGKDTLGSIQKDADAMKRLPFVGGYVEDPAALLIRPKAERNRKTFAEADLFEPGRAVLTSSGRERLDAVAPWLEGLKHPGSDVVVVAYADPKTNSPAVARELTRNQSEAVCDYLKSKHAIQKMGWFSSRKVTPLGQGTQLPPAPESDPLPPSRVEVVVFVPQQG